MNQRLDIIGIGLGPSNLSLAALGSEIEGFTGQFLERKPHFSWHPGMILADCSMQTNFLKDLVSAVAPTNRYSFLNYLVKTENLSFPNDGAAHRIARRVRRLPHLGRRRDGIIGIQSRRSAGRI